MDPFARDRRMDRALHEVAGKYAIKALRQEGVCTVYQVSLSRKRDYQVTVAGDWSVAPACSCPDGKRWAAQALANGAAQVIEGDGGPAGVPPTWCKHVLAVLLGDPALRGQLLDLFL